MVEQKIIEENLAQLASQDLARELITKSLLRGQCSTYLLVGPPGVGKGLLARLMAASWHNTLEVDKPHLDTIVFDEVLAANGGESEEKKWKQTVDDVIHLVHLSPATSAYRVLIVDDIDRLSVSATNALLKTLEEPAVHARIVITAQNAAAVLPTIRSRAQIIRLNAVSDAVVAETLKQAKVKDVATVIMLANGSLRTAKAISQSPELIRSGQVQLESLKSLLSHDVVAGMQTANVKERSEAIDLVAGWANLSRRLLIDSEHGKAPNWLPKDQSLPTAKQISRWLDRLNEAQLALDNGANARVVLEALTLYATQAL